MAAEVSRTEVSYPVAPSQVEEYDWTLQRLHSRLESVDPSRQAFGEHTLVSKAARC